MHERRTYNVLISGEDIARPIDDLVELPIWLADMAMESHPDGIQEAARTVLVAHFAAEYSDTVMVSPDSQLTWDNITIRLPFGGE